MSEDYAIAFDYNPPADALEHGAQPYTGQGQPTFDYKTALDCCAELNSRLEKDGFHHYPLRG